ncbi:MAG: hypothetical protein IIY96_00490, partial [Lachnospiraceae bacterium]|nr:hypothetical protein [Lachnospiraceae bacterium]
TFAKHDIGLKSVMQRAGINDKKTSVPLIFIIYETEYKTLMDALDEIREKDFAESIDAVMRVQDL